ncbi:MAG: alpha/beta hydrolase [Acidimicrobiia bacterium]
MREPDVLEPLREADVAAIDRFVSSNQFPLVEPGKATFVYRGQAEAVALRPMIAGFPGQHRFARFDGQDLWWLGLPLPDGTRLEYKLEVQRDHHADWINDPLNPLTTTNPFGTNSVCRGFGYVVPAFAEVHPDTPTGTFADIFVGSRKLTLYRPASFEPAQSYPLLFVHDGGDYLEYGSMALVLDNLIHTGAIGPLVAAFSWPQERLHEYAASDDHARFVVEEALAAILEEIPLLDRRVVLGASLGAVAALHVAWRYPGTFSGMILQSGTFAQTRGWGSAQQLLAPIANLLHRLEPSLLPQRVFMSCGTFERMIGENRTMSHRLERAGLKVKYVENRDGHTWEAWRDRLSEALGWVL